MNYKFKDNIIYNDEAMWNLALTFKCRYESIRKQVKLSETDNSIIYEGKVIMKWNENYKKILSDYKKELEFMNNMIGQARHDNKLRDYIETDS